MSEGEEMTEADPTGLLPGGPKVAWTQVSDLQAGDRVLQKLWIYQVAESVQSSNGLWKLVLTAPEHYRGSVLDEQFPTERVASISGSARYRRVVA
jgi:hypothetical protein